MNLPDNDHDRSIYKTPIEAQRAREKAFWCDEFLYIWYKKKRLGHVFDYSEWEPDDLKFYKENCAGK